MPNRRSSESEGCASGLAVHGIGLMAHEGAARTLIGDLARPHQRLRQPHEQRNADDHRDDRGDPPPRPRQRDVSEAGRGHRGHGEVQRIEIAVDAGDPIGEGGIDEPRHHEEEGDEVHDRPDRLLPPVEPVRPKLSPDDGAAKERPEAQDPEEGEVHDPHRRKQRDQDHEIDPDIGSKQPAPDVQRGECASEQIEPDQRGYGIVNDQEAGMVRQQRRRQEKRDDGEIDRDEADLEAPRKRRVAEIQEMQLAAHPQQR